MSNFKIQEGVKTPFYHSPFDAHCCVYSIVNAREFISWLTFT